MNGRTVPLSKEEIKELETVNCEACGNHIFGQGLIIKKLPSVHPANDTGKMQYIDVLATVCGICKNEISVNS